MQDSLTSTQQQGLTQSEDITQKVIDYMSEHIGATETQKSLREGIGAMGPWANKFLAEHNEYKPGSISIGGEKLALEQNYIEASSEIASQTEKALSRDHALADTQVIENSRENGLDVDNFNISTNTEDRVKKNLEATHKKIELGKMAINQEKNNLENSILEVEQSTLIGRLAKNTVGLDIDKVTQDNAVPTTNMQRKK